MYSDRDGTASKQSQAEYDSRVQKTLLSVSILSAVGFAAAAANGDYTDISFRWKLSIWGLHLQPSGPLLWPIICANSLNLYRQSGNPIAVYQGALGGVLIAALLLYHSLQSLGSNRATLGEYSTQSLVQTICSFLLILLQILLPRRPSLYTTDGRLVDGEGGATALSCWLLSWCTPTLDVATTANSLDDLPSLEYGSRSCNQQDLSSPATGSHLWRRICKQCLPMLTRQLAFLLARLALDFAEPYCIMNLLRGIEDAGRMSHDAWFWLATIGATKIAYFVFNTQLRLTHWPNTGLPINAQIKASLFQKLLRRKNAKSTTTPSESTIPDIASVVSSDARSISTFAGTAYILLHLVLRSIFSIIFLFRLLSWQSAGFAIVATAALLSTNAFFSKKATAARKVSRSSRNHTASVLKEAFYALREIKFSSLESQWDTHIENCREQELRDWRAELAASNLQSSWNTASALVIATTSVCAHMLFGGRISSSIIYPMVAILPRLQSSLGFFPEMIKQYNDSVAAAERIDKYLAAPEQEVYLKQNTTGHVVFRNATVAWPSDESTKEDNEKAPTRFHLNNLNLTFPPGELSVISGTVGSGKSLLLASILGEADLLDGDIEAPSAANGRPVAFVSQTPWLQNATVEQNILFGSKMDRERYNRVVAACALLPDLAALTDGDQTQVGLRGVKLSGGQKARLAFARALFSSTEVIIMDDIFAALDTHVANQILTALTGELCKGRTRILVTHHVSLCAASTKYRVHLNNNAAEYAGDSDPVSSPIPALVTKDIRVPLDEEKVSPASDQAANPTVASTKTTEGTWQHVYIQYFTAAGGLVFVVLYAASLATDEVFSAWTQYLFGRINSSEPTDSVKPEFGSAHHSELRSDLSVYLAVAVASVAIAALSDVYYGIGTRRASRKLFQKMTFNVLRMPLLWMDSTSFGEIFKTFTADARRVDDRLLRTLATIAKNLVKVVTIISIGLTTSRYVGLVTACLFAWCMYIGTRYVKARSKLRLGGSIHAGGIIEHCTTASDGLTTIRAFGAQAQCIDSMHQLLDDNTLSYRYFWVFHDWVSLQLSLVSVAFTILTCAFLLSSGSEANVGSIGFALTFFGGLQRAMFNVINQYGHLGTFSDSLKSVVRYTELETERLGGADVSPGWPFNGRVEVENVEVSYGPDLPLVLKSMAFIAEARTRVGIVGRTGAGKSSLSLSLLRLLELKSGRIYIDGIDIAQMKVGVLRSEVAFIPQDPTLFSGTIRSNLDYFKKVPVEEIKEALRHVNLLAEDGDESSGLFTVDSPISAGGANMSQGQRQLLCLARILIRKPRIIILDEATSAVDSKTDLLMQDVIRSHFKGTLIAVAHRLRTVAAFDKIVVVDDGQVAEKGTPKELLEKKGAFYDLVKNSQDHDDLVKTIMGEKVKQDGSPEKKEP